MKDLIFQNKRILITGGTGSLGKTLVKRILKGEWGIPQKIIVFSRDEAKQFFMRQEYLNLTAATDEIIFSKSELLKRLQFEIGDIRNLADVEKVVDQADIIFNAAALKQVPTCEYFPFQAVQTNIIGPQNLVTALREHRGKLIVGISTDKATKPTNVMGMTKAIQEKIFIEANRNSNNQFVCARYGNVLASRGSVIPLFQEKIKQGLPLTVTTKDMTRFLMSLDRAVDTIIKAATDTFLNVVRSGCTYIPKTYAAKIIDVATIMAEGKVPVEITGIRPGEKIHEELVSAEEYSRTLNIGDYYVIKSMLPELDFNFDITDIPYYLDKPYTSNDELLNLDQIKQLLKDNNLL